MYKVPKMEYCIELIPTALKPESIRRVKKPKLSWLSQLRKI